jgi:type VI protein secretion system component VasK
MGLDQLQELEGDESPQEPAEPAISAAALESLKELGDMGADQLKDLFADWLPSDLSPQEAFQKIFIPYFAIWSFGEALPVLDRPGEISNPASINAAYSRITRLILNDLNWQSLDALADPADIAQSRVHQKAELDQERDRIANELEEQRAALQADEESLKKSQSNRAFWFAATTAFVVAVLASVAVFYTSSGTQTQIEELTNINTNLTKTVSISAASVARLEEALAQAESQLSAAHDDLDQRNARFQVEIKNAQVSREVAVRDLLIAQSSLATASNKRDGALAAIEDLSAALQAEKVAFEKLNNKVTALETRASINTRWQEAVLPLCSSATGDAYPFNRRSPADISMPDFTTLFGPGGQIDTFFSQNLAVYVDVRTRPWSLKKVNNADMVSQAFLTQMQHAAEIRDAFFTGGPVPFVAFQITPESLDPNAEGIVLEIDGQNVAFWHKDGEPRPSPIKWPVAVGEVRVTFSPGEANSENSLEKDGPWAWFRLLDSAVVSNTKDSDLKRVVFNIGGRVATFQVRVDSVLNPFDLPALSKFSCPKSFC